MKCNCNNLSNTFDHEFNLSVNEIINAIDKVYNFYPAGETINQQDVEIALFNDDFYIRPGIKKDAFMDEWCKMCAEIKATFGNEDDTAYRIVILESIDIIKRYFDPKYYKEQIERRKHSSDNKNKLRTYMHKLNKGHLFNFMKMVACYRSQYGLFISETSSITFWKHIDDECRKVGFPVPKDLDSYEGQTFLDNNAFYYFKVLSTKTIASLLYNAIDLDVNIAGSAAKKLYKSGYDAMIDYVNRNISH